MKSLNRRADWSLARKTLSPPASEIRFADGTRYCRARTGTCISIVSNFCMQYLAVQYENAAPCQSSHHLTASGSHTSLHNVPWYVSVRLADCSISSGMRGAGQTLPSSSLAIHDRHHDATRLSSRTAAERLYLPAPDSGTTA